VRPSGPGVGGKAALTGAGSLASAGRQFAATANAAEIETAILESDFLSRFGKGKAVKKVVVVPSRMVNVVV
jgi:leucyl-tRNA synthetase